MTRLLAGSALSLLLMAGGTALAQNSGASTGDSSPLDHVEGEVPATGGDDAPAGGQPVEDGEANAPDQQPAFEGQTRAAQPENPVEVSTEVIAEGLPQLWSMEFLPDNRMLVATKAGDMHILSQDGEPGPAIEGVPEVMSEGQGGLLDIALAPDFEQSNTIYFSFSEPREDGNGTSVAKATLTESGENGGALDNVEVIFQQMPSYDGDKHFGSRLVFSPEGHLFVTVGERSDTPIRDEAQDLTSGLGKVFRIDPATGEAIEDNPFYGHAKIQPEIFSYGHRNLQSAALDAEGRLWTVEHGPAGGDELNRPESGINYGWPAITYGVAYSGEEIGPGRTAQEGMAQPVYYWDPVIGPSGMALYQGDQFPDWQDAMIIGGLVTEGLVVVRLDDAGERVATEERIPLGERIRDVKVGSDGAIYAVSEIPDSDASTIIKVTAAE
ncbi:PQQ-dependent sugar dehydrogenase [Fulvimarina endophytica]